MSQVLISLGSNIDGEHNLPEAVRRLALRCRVVAVSPVYETTPVGDTKQPNYLNAAALVETDLTTTELKARVLRVIEQEMGRVRSENKNAPRTIDLDIAVFGRDPDSGTEGVCDPAIFKHAHIAVPLADIAPHIHQQETGRSLREIAHNLPACGLVPRPDVVLWPNANDRSTEEG